MQRVSSWLIALLAIAAFVAAGYVVARKDPVPDAGRTLPLPPVATTAPSTGTSGAADASDAGAGSRVVAFLGDDWTSGVGASSRARRFTSLLAASLGLTEKNFGVDGTGYAKSASGGGAYDTRVDAVVKADPSIVIVSGGRNDTSDFVPTLRSRIASLFTTLRTRLPDATIIAVEPMWGDSDKPADLAPVAAAVRTSVVGAGGTYVALADPVHGHPGYMGSAADPNDKGYAAIATALTPRIRALLPR